MTHTDIVNSVDFSSDSKYLISGSNDGTTRLFEIATKRVVESVAHDATVNSVAISGNNKYILSGTSDFRVRVWLTDAKSRN